MPPVHARITHAHATLGAKPLVSKFLAAQSSVHIDRSSRANRRRDVRCYPPDAARYISQGQARNEAASRLTVIILPFEPHTKERRTLSRIHCLARACAIAGPSQYSRILLICSCFLMLLFCVGNVCTSKEKREMATDSDVMQPNAINSTSCTVGVRSTTMLALLARTVL
jgi:hypothetical protein